MLDDQTIIVVIAVLVVLQVWVPGVDFVAMASDWFTNQVTFW